MTRLWWFSAAIAYVAVSFLLLDLARLSADAADIVLKLGFLPFAVGLWIVDTWLENRQRANDLEKVSEAIRLPLRNAALGAQEPIDFDPHFPTVSPGGNIVSAIDPNRRTLSFIVTNMVDKDGVAMREGGRIDGRIINVTRTIITPKRRWFGLLPPSPTAKGNVELSVLIVHGNGEPDKLTMQFRSDDHAAEDWRRIFVHWAHEDRVSQA